MRYLTIYDKPVATISFDDMVAYFYEEAFVKFMNEGRSGLVSIGTDLVDNFEVNVSHKLVSGNDRSTPLGSRELSKLYTQAARLLMDNFMASGTKGLRDAIFSIHQLVHNACADHIQKAKKE